MNLPAALRTVGWMARDTIRQSFASRLFWAMLGVSCLCILFCFSVRAQEMSRIPTKEGEAKTALPDNDPVALKLGKDKLKKEGIDLLGEDQLSLGFGAFTVRTNRGKADSVRFLQVWLAGLVAGTAGIFLSIVWTAGFLPTFLEPSNVTVLLAKPVPRWSLLTGKVLGVLFFVLLQASFFVIGTWFALGIATGEFDPRYLFAIPVLLLHFTAFYSFSVMLAVWTRSTVVCVFGTILFWVLCWGINYGRHALVAHDPVGVSTSSQFIMEIGYWALPKPADMNAIFDDALDTEGFAANIPEIDRVRQQGHLLLGWSAFASLLFSLAMLLISIVEFRKAEY